MGRKSISIEWIDRMVIIKDMIGMIMDIIIMMKTDIMIMDMVIISNHMTEIITMVDGIDGIKTTETIIIQRDTLIAEAEEGEMPRLVITIDQKQNKYAVYKIISDLAVYSKCISITQYRSSRYTVLCDFKIYFYINYHYILITPYGNMKVEKLN